MKSFFILMAAFLVISCGTEEQAAHTHTKEEAPAVVETTPAETTETTETAETASSDTKWLTQYVAVQEALAADSFENASAALKELVALSEGETKTSVEAAANAADIGAMRVAFQPFSEALKGKALPQDLQVVYCPMAFDNKGAHWVQKKGQIMNPYFGASMLHCGAPVVAQN